MLLDNKTVLLDNHTMLLDIHRNAVAGQDGTDDQHQSVSPNFSVHPTINPDPSLDSCQVSWCKVQGFVVSHHIVVHWENYLPLHRGLVSDATD